MYTSYLWLFIQFIAFVKCLNIIVLIVNKRLEFRDIFDFKPFGLEHHKLREIAFESPKWKRRLLLAQIYIHQGSILLLMFLAFVAIIYLMFRDML
jgi:hypothetical protein